MEDGVLLPKRNEESLCACFNGVDVCRAFKNDFFVAKQLLVYL